VEALCELRFVSEPERKWDWAIPGLLYSRIAPRFPIRQQRHTISLPVDGPVALTGQGGLAQFVATDGSTMVQVGPDLLAVNSLRPHLGWADLRDTLASVLQAYREIAVPTTISMAAVRYINRVDIPLRGLTLERYFTVLPGLPDKASSEITKFLIHTEVKYDDPSALFRFRFGPTDSSNDTVATFLLDYEHISNADTPGFEALSAWLDAGHERIETAFYGSFTAFTHTEIFQEIRS
jgi:uncharacterized protein (TIGR04255 family)